jgi:hypothetical protein
MNQLSQAIAILERARQALVERLAEKVVESAEEIIDDAEGRTYGAEIDAIHDQIALRLLHVNSMLAVLPHSEFAAPLPPGLPAPPGFETATMTSEHSLESGAVTMLTVDAAQPGPASEAPSFQTFVGQIQADDLAGAAQALAELLDLPSERTLACAVKFREQMASHPDFLMRAMELRRELHSGSVNGALMLLWECFGLQGPESIGVMLTLRSRLAA